MNNRKQLSDNEVKEYIYTITHVNKVFKDKPYIVLANGSVVRRLNEAPENIGSVFKMLYDRYKKE